MSFNSEDLVFRLGAKFDIKPEELKAQLESTLAKLKDEIKVEGTKLVINTEEADKNVENVLKKITTLKQEIQEISKLNLGGAKVVAPTTPTTTNTSSTSKGDDSALSNVIQQQEKITSEINKQRESTSKYNTALEDILIKYEAIDKFRKKSMVAGEDELDVSKNFNNFQKENEFYDKRNELLESFKLHLNGINALTKEQIDSAKKLIPVYDRLAEKELKASFGVTNTGKTRIDSIEKANQVKLYDELIRKTKLLAEIESQMIKLDKSGHRKEYNLLSIEVDKAKDAISKITDEIQKSGLESKAFESQLETLQERLNFKNKQQGVKIFDSQTKDIQTLEKEIIKAEAEFKKFLLTNEKMPTQQIDRYSKKFGDLVEQLKQAKNFNEDVVAKSGVKGIQNAVDSRFDIMSNVDKQLAKMKSTINKYSNENQLVIKANIEENNLNKVLNSIKSKLNEISNLKANAGFIDIAELEKTEKELRNLEKTAKKLNFDESNPKSFSKSIKEAEKLKIAYGGIAVEIKRLKDLEKQNNKAFGLEEGLNNLDRKANAVINSLINKKAELEAKKNTVNFIDNDELDKVIANIDNVINSINNVKSKEILNESSLKSANSDLKTIGSEISNINATIKLLNTGNKIDAGLDSFLNKSKDMERSLINAKDNIKKMSMSLGDAGSKDLKNLLDQVDKLEKELKNASDITKEGFQIKNADSQLDKIKDGLYEVNQEMKRVQTESQAVSDVFGKAFNVNTITSYVAQFYVVRQAIRSIYNEVSLLDSALTTLRMTMGGSEGAYYNLIDGAVSLASETGTQMDTVLDVVKTYANATDSVEEVMNKIKPTIALSNIGEMSASDAVNNIQSIMKQFKLVEAAAGDVNAATYRTTDSITAISKALQMDFGQGIREIAAGIMESGAAIEAAGMSYERYAALLSAVAEQSRLSGSQIGNALVYRAI